MKRLLSIWLLLLPIIAMAQLKHDANWVFGKNAGIDFNEVLNPISYYSNSNNFETTAVYSNTAGDLELYIATEGFNNTSASIFNSSHVSIDNGSGLFVNNSATNGAVFLNVPSAKDSVFLFHIGNYSNSCNFTRCYRLYYTLIVKGISGTWQVVSKNNPLLNEPINEAISLVKHSNGKDYWLFVHEQRVNIQDSCARKFFSFSISNSGINGPYIQNFGEAHCDIQSYIGEMPISWQGDLIADVIYGDNIVPVYRINRCSGILSPNLNGQVIHLVNDETYSAVFSGNFIYVATLKNGAGGIYRYDLRQSNIDATKQVLWLNNIPDVSIGQMERVDNNIIAISIQYNGLDSTLKNKYSKHFHIIENSSQPAPMLRYEYLYIGDSAQSNAGLPNFPNYNLGPEGVFLAYAGKDTVLCSNTNSTGVPIGTPPVPNVTYLWQPALGLSATNIAQPTANPIQSTWYYLTATDTTATSCAVNTDSVYVKVEACTGINETPAAERWDYRLKPNLFNSGKTATINLALEETGTVEIYNIQGALVGSYKVEQGKNVLTLDKALTSSSVYIYKVYTGNQLRHTDKLVVVE